MYWDDRAKSRETFQGPWTRSGDDYLRDANGSMTHPGRSDDMLKVGGVWVSPFEVEATLVRHASVLEAAVVGVADRRPHQDEGRGRAQAPQSETGGELQPFVKTASRPTNIRA